jgi:hypothetical protein
MVVALGAAGLVIAVAHPASANDWAKDSLTGCEMFMPDKESDEKISWSGTCTDGKASGSGVLVVINSKGLAGVYEGDVVKGRAEGEGRISVRNEKTGGVDVYTGDFANGTLDGEGELVSSEGWTYTGGFKDGEEHGAGTVETTNGDKFRSAFENGNPVGPALVFYKTEGGETYFGEAENKKRNGQGHLIKANDDVYVGEFEDGVASGAGTYDTAGGGVFIGTFAEGSPNGFGTYEAANGDIYQGRFVNGKPTGKILVTKNGTEQAVETWENGEKKE